MPIQAVRLGVNIDHVAGLRQARGERYPEPVDAALTAERAGADGITLHLREDRRHIQDRDVFVLRDVLQTPMNLELAITDEMIANARQVRPAHCCLVPEKRQELTTEGGLDVAAQRERVRRACAELADAGVRVSLFIDPEAAQIEAAAEVGAPAVELHTGDYAQRPGAEALQRLARCAEQARAAGLEVHAGHGLHYHNVQPVAAIAPIVELNIGHSIVARAVFNGLAEAVREMKRLMMQARYADQAMP